MARHFASASSQYFGGQAPVVTAAPLTISGWVRFPGSVPSGTVSIVTLAAASSSDIFELYWDQSFTTVGFLAGNAAGGLGQATASGTANSANTWYHFCGRTTTTSNRDAALNGNFGSANTTAITPASLVALYLGVQRYSGALSLYLNGDLAEVGIWNDALTNSEVSSLAAGFSPLMVRPQNLGHYIPLFGRATDEEDWMTATNGPYTNSGSATVTDHPPLIIYPGVAEIAAAAAAVASGTLKTAIGLARASVKTINGLAIGSVKTYDTLTA